MSGFVLDCSAAIAMLVKSQTTKAAQHFAAALPDQLIAPHVFAFEVRHVLLKLERRKVLAPGAADAELGALESAVDVLEAGDADHWNAARSVARRINIGFFDAFYLVLSIEENAALVSRDGPLIAAAQALGLKVLDLRDTPA